ncbi:uncharacterized protein TNCV_2350191 [Trichonephila clavipes]|uniref:Uncharacterized protein n=1 Tax=Trichonephila clavipes TaxID=2585209 RepID=A0A8X6SRI6_TRICX|nr:uncharacterized protein TNCV_2350191 [Trichonephila clavipes]
MQENCNSWGKYTTEDLKKCKTVLNNPDESEVEIVKALSSLRKKNPNKNAILSVGLDSTLKRLLKHENSKVVYEVRMLENHWSLNKSSDIQAVQIIKKQSPKKNCDIPSDIKVYENQKINQLDEKSEVTDDIDLKVSPNSFGKQSDSKLGLGQPKRKLEECFKHSKKVCRSSVGISRYYNVMHQLEKAVKLFTLELGEQEVKLYLENQVQMCS